MRSWNGNGSVVIVLFALTGALALSAKAQQTQGTLGSPSATITIDGKQLPPPDPKFGGVIRRRLRSRRPGGRRGSYRRRAHPTCCSS